MCWGVIFNDEMQGLAGGIGSMAEHRNGLVGVFSRFIYTIFFEGLDL